MNVSKNEVEKPSGPYTVWINYGAEGWQPTDCETLEAALKLQKHGSQWTVQKAVKFKIVEEDDAG
jgi:hypothetical protein